MSIHILYIYIHNKNRVLSINARYQPLKQLLHLVVSVKLFLVHADFLASASPSRSCMYTDRPVRWSRGAQITESIQITNITQHPPTISKPNNFFCFVCERNFMLGQFFWSLLNLHIIRMKWQAKTSRNSYILVKRKGDMTFLLTLTSCFFLWSFLLICDRETLNTCSLKAFFSTHAGSLKILAWEPRPPSRPLCMPARWGAFCLGFCWSFWPPCRSALVSWRSTERPETHKKGVVGDRSMLISEWIDGTHAWLSCVSKTSKALFCHGRWSPPLQSA